jgi:hypothetical protein
VTKKKQIETEPKQLCEICNEGNIAVAILRNGKFACRQCAEDLEDSIGVLRWLK